MRSTTSNLSFLPLVSADPYYRNILDLTYHIDAFSECAIASLVAKRGFWPTPSYGDESGEWPMELPTRAGTHYVAPSASKCDRESLQPFEKEYWWPDQIPAGLSAYCIAFLARTEPRVMPIAWEICLILRSLEAHVSLDHKQFRTTALSISRLAVQHTGSTGAFEWRPQSRVSGGTRSNAQSSTTQTQINLLIALMSSGRDNLAMDLCTGSVTSVASHVFGYAYKVAA